MRQRLWNRREPKLAKSSEILGLSLAAAAGLAVMTGFVAEPMGSDPNASQWLLNGLYAAGATALIGYGGVL